MAPVLGDLGVGEWPLSGLFQTLLPDFVLAFAFFSALVYAVLARRFEHQRSAVVMSAAVGLALAMGIVWWEQQSGWSVRNLGPIAVGFGLMLLALLLFQGVKQTGGSWAGAGIACGVALLIAWVLGLGPDAGWGVIQSLAIVALVVGIVAWLLHHHGVVSHIHPIPRSAVLEVPDVHHDMSDLYEDRHVGERLHEGLHRLRKQVYGLERHPQDASGVMARIQRILPAEGWLTGRLAQLRARAHLIREGHVHRLAELEQFLAGLSHAARKQLSAELAAGYRKVVGIDDRIERLDRSVADVERRVRELTLEAREALARYDYAKLYDLLNEAEKLQKHNDRLIHHIEHTEKKLGRVVDAVAAKASRHSQR